MVSFSLRLSCWRYVAGQSRSERLDICLMLSHLLFWIALPGVWIGWGADVIELLCAHLDPMYLSCICISAKSPRERD